MMCAKIEIQGAVGARQGGPECRNPSALLPEVSWEAIRKKRAQAGI